MKRLFQKSLAAATCAALALAAQAAGAQSPAASAPTAAPAARHTGTSNAPNASPIAPGGIQANQLAADESALDKILNASIASGNVDGVRDALKAGVNLRQSFAYGCSPWASWDQNGPENFTSISGSQAQRMPPNSLPGQCLKQHFLHALSAASKATRLEVGGGPATAASMAVFDPEKVALLRHPNPKASAARADVVAKLKALREARDNAFEILALLDANLPAADKAFYPAYLGVLTTPPDPVVSRWVLNRYFEALPEIKRARALREPSRMAWDAFKAQLPDGRVSYDLALFDPAAIPNGDESYTLKEAATRLLVAYGGRAQAFANEAICKEREGLKHITNAQRLAEKTAELAFVEKHLADYTDAYTSKGLAARPFSQFERELMQSAGENRNLDLVRLWGYAATYYQIQSLFAFLLEKPEVIDALNNKQTTPAGESPPLHRVAFALNAMSRGAPAPVRAMLNAGVSPNLRDAAGKTAIDLTLGATPMAMWQSQAFLKKDMVHGGCRP